MKSLSLYFKLSAVLLILAGTAGINVAVWGLHRRPPAPHHQVPAADAERGRALMTSYGCITCHIIPGVPGAAGRVGPRLDEFQDRVYIAGVLANSGQNLTYWIQNPRDVSPETAMPDLNVSEPDARDMAAYLYSIR